MTDEQRKAFLDKLTKYFDYLDKHESSDDVLDKWGVVLYSRFRYSYNGSSNSARLSDEHMAVLRNMLTDRNITEDEYMSVRGNTLKLVQLINSKKSLSLDELKSLREKLDSKINALKQKHSTRYKKLYNMSDEEYKKIEDELSILNEKRKKINSLIEGFSSNESNVPLKEVKHDRISELLKINENLQSRVNELEKDKKDFSLEESKLRHEYYEKYRNLLLEKEKQVVDEYNSKLEDEKKKIEAVYKAKADRFEKDVKSTYSNLKNDREIIKSEIVNMLCSKNSVSINDIYSKFSNKDRQFILSVLRELRVEIPGISSIVDGSSMAYSICHDSCDRLSDYGNLESPILFGGNNGVFSFIVRSDLHLNMNSSKDDIKRIFYPYMNFCSSKGNMPIVDLGDLADTRKNLVLKDWQNLNRDAIKQSYNFFRNYAKVLSGAPDVNHYTLFGNHDEHPFMAGVDPIEIIYGYTNNFNLLGVSSGSFKIGKDSIGVFHDKSWQNVISSIDEPDRYKRNLYIYNYLCKEIGNIASDYVYSLIGHYHFGKINPNERFAVINNGIESSLLFTASVINGSIDKMFVSELYVDNGCVRKSLYDYEIYNKEKSFIKK